MRTLFAFVLVTASLAFAGPKDTKVQCNTCDKMETNCKEQVQLMKKKMSAQAVEQVTHKCKEMADNCRKDCREKK